jgi:hypothetical protein
MEGRVTLHLRHLQLRAQTPKGRFGADIPFDDGLFVLRADNSRGKSTAVQSILFALGLERMITTHPTNAVTAAMRDRLIFDATTKEETPVLSSWVSLEISNHLKSVATVTRWVKHETFEPGLVQVVHGAALSDPGTYEVTNHYTGRAGAVANPQGFHRWLAKFIGWNMPEFAGPEGRTVQLYMEQVFPLLFVEQRRGWGGIQAQMPYFSGLSDVRVRAIEFLLALDVGELDSQRQRLKARDEALIRTWRGLVSTFSASLVGEGLVPIRIPESLTVAWPPSPPPTVAQSVDSIWIDLQELLARLRSELAALEAAPVPTVEQAAPELDASLPELYDQASDVRETAALLHSDLFRDREELRSIERRLAALADDLREHQDVVTLARLGAAGVAVTHEDCPVCHRALPESLLGDRSLPALSPEDTVSYIRQQIEMFEVMRRDGQRAFAAKSERWASLQAQDSDIRARIRTIRSSLLGSGDAPSADSVAQRIRKEDRIARLEQVLERFLELEARLDRIASEARDVRGELANLPTERLSENDSRKLAALEVSFVQQLRAYDFGSFSDERLMVSRDNYHPRRDDFDLQADISASDSIRVVWAYLLGLLEVARQFETNHPQFLVFDEPRQQSAKEVSFSALLRRAAADAERGQVIFATSEELPALQAMLVDIPHRLHAVDGYLLEPVAE